MNTEKALNLIFKDLTLDTSIEGRHFDNAECKQAGRYRARTTKSGDWLECELYPVWIGSVSTTSRIVGSIEDEQTEAQRKEAQKRVNAEWTKRRIMQLVNANFTVNDIKVTLPYDEDNLPDSLEQAKRDVKNYVRRLKTYAKKQGWEDLKYIYVTDTSGKSRIHHHLIINFPDRDVAESKWNKGAYPKAARLSKRYNSLCNVGAYMAKNALRESKYSEQRQEPGKKAKRYGYSLDLEKTWKKATTSDSKVRNNEVKRIIEDRDDIPKILERIYPGYYFKDIRIKQNKKINAYYIYAEMLKFKKTKRSRL